MPEENKIEQATANALKVISQAEETARHSLATSAADALKVTNVNNNSDHDTLIEIKTIVTGLVADVKDLKTNMVGRVEQLEINKASCTSLNDIEKEISGLQKWRYVTVGMGIIVGTVLSLICYIYLTEQSKQDIKIENVIEMCKTTR